MANTHISIRIPPKLNSQLEAYTERHGATKTEIILSALAKYLEVEPEVSLTDRIAFLERRMTKLEINIGADSSWAKPN